MSIRTIMWTALPNGVKAPGDRLRLSVLVSPRLTTDNGTDGLLAQFPDFLDWPAVVASLRFRVEFQGGPAFVAQHVVEAPYPALDPAAWKALFNKDTFVRSYQFDDRKGRAVRSFPTKEVLSFVTSQYKFFAVNSPSDKPNIETLGFDPAGGQGAQLGQIVMSPGVVRQINDRLETLLKEFGAVPAGAGFPAMDFYQVQLMHEFLSKKVKKPDGTLEPLPPQQPTEVDFHKAVASLGQYPSLMRAMAIAIDLEVPHDGVAATGNVRVTPQLDGPPPMTPWTAYRFRVADRVFLPAPTNGSDVTDGMLLLNGPVDYDVVEVDVDGAARKLADFATNVSRIVFGQAKSSIDTPQNYGLPALRSAGFSAARASRALRLVGTFQAAHDHNAAVVANPQNSGVVLHSDDVTRGYRVDVWSSLNGQWRSLCLREGKYTFTDTSLTRSFSDEGFTTVATSQSADGTTTDMRLPESLFRWAGWSLCAPRAGKTIGSDSTPSDPQNPATTQIHLETTFTVQKGTLPRLRFGASYQFRARAVDLAGNSIPHDAVLDDINNLPPQPVPYLRCEPVSAPAVVLRAPLDPVGTPGESLNRIVVRSNFNTHIAGVSERHLAPPKTSETMAEEHGMLDTPSGPPDKAAYPMLVNKDGSFNQDPAHPDEPSPQPEAQLTLPYLPDPFAPGAAFATLHGTAPGTVWKQAFTGTWPEILPFRLVLDEGAGPPVFTESATERVLRVRLPKAEIAVVELSGYLTDDDTTKPPRMLSQMQIWQWIVEEDPPNLSDLRRLALDGGHWMLTPPKTLTLVHAVQQPLIEPEFQDLTVERSLAQTFASLIDAFPISGKSTIRVDIQGTWTEPVDDLSDAAQPVILNGSAQAFQVPIAATDTVAFIDNAHAANKHEFHDTRHRTVNYTATATTRFREYFPDALTADPANITRLSQPVTRSIPSSARPLAPKPLYVLPIFGWEGQTEGAWNFSRRTTGLRVYLDRPWYTSGEGELLGAVLWQCPPPQHTGFQSFEVPDVLRSYVTQWGMDPIWSASPLPSQAVPLPKHFLNAVAFADGLSLSELGQFPFVPVSVAGHTVAYDNDRQLWYCDIEMESGDAYFPFIRLALARYQPESIVDAHLSRVVLADFAQLLPGRSVSITFDGLDPTVLNLAVTGLTFNGPGTAAVAVTVQEQVPGSGDLAWIPASLTRLNPVKPFLGQDTLWTAQINLPAPRGSRPMRLLIEEYETYATDQPGGPSQTRLVYADILNV